MVRIKAFDGTKEYTLRTANSMTEAEAFCRIANWQFTDAQGKFWVLYY